MKKIKLLGTDNAKTSKGELLGYRTAILYMTPSRHDVNGVQVNSCIKSNKACEILCLAKSGHGMKPIVKQARLNRSHLYYSNRDLFNMTLEKEIKNHIKYSEKNNLIPVVRLNGTTDLNFFDIYKKFPEIVFYEYTKNIEMALSKDKPDNVHFTFSYSGTNFLDSIKALENGINVAMVFERDFIKPKKIFNHDVISGDNHDLRFLDAKGKIISLTYKSMMPKDATQQIPALRKYSFLLNRELLNNLEKKYNFLKSKKYKEVA